MSLYRLMRPALFALDAEPAHRLAITGLKLGAVGKPPTSDPRVASTVAGLTFPSPVGMAAGFDKDAEVYDALLGQGWGSVEVGTITPLPQPGNAKPRSFRLAEDEAAINRFGFNSRGQGDALKRLSKRDRSRGIVGVNIGANKDSPDRIADYAEGVKRMGSVADYLTINISSPNTPGLRQLQDEGALRALLEAVRDAGAPVPVFLKVAPDQAEGEPEQIVRAAVDHGIDALIVGNTTVTRPRLKSPHAGEAGGLSGRPLKPLALDALRRFRSASGGELPLVGVGGIGTVDDAWERIRAGASLVQLYTAMIYEGPAIGRRVAQGLSRKLDESGFGSIAEAVGSE